MAFAGELTPAELAMLPADENAEAEIEEAARTMGSDAQGLMAFRCRSCGCHRFHVDLD